MGLLLLTSLRRSTKSGRKSEEEVLFKHRREDGDGEDEDEDESVSPTSGPSLEFANPWDNRTTASRRKPRPFDDEGISMAAETAGTRGRRKMPRGFEGRREFEEEEEVEVHEKRSVPRSTAGLSKGTADEWSATDTLSKIDAAEMSGALSVIEVAPKHAVEEELERDMEEMEIGQQVEKEHRDERWTEITKELVVREAIKQLGYEFEETRTHYYVFSFLEQVRLRHLDPIYTKRDAWLTVTLI